MSRFAGIDKACTPGGSMIVGDLESAIGVVAAGDDERREGERFPAVRPETHQMLWTDRGIGDIRWSHQKGAGDIVSELRCRLDDGRRAKRMGDKDHGPRRLFRGIDDRPRPVIQNRLGPIGLLDPPGGFQPLLPAGLPVLSAGIRVAGDDQDICFRGFHDGADVRSTSVEVNAGIGA